MSAKMRILSVMSIAVVFGWLFAGQCFAGQGDVFTSEDMDAMVNGLDFGPEWTKVADGVWEREGKDGIVYRRIFGESGVQWLLAREREKLVNMLDENAMVAPGLENRARFLLEKIRSLEEGPADPMALAKNQWEQDSGTRCDSPWQTTAYCGLTSHYAQSYIDGRPDGPSCDVVAKGNTHYYSDITPAGKHHTETDYVDEGEGLAMINTGDNWDKNASWHDVEAYAAAWFWAGSGWYKVSVECEHSY